MWSRLKGHPGITTFLGFCADFDRREVWLISSWEPNGNVSEFIKGRELEVPEKLALVSVYRTFGKLSCSNLALYQAYDTIDALAFLHQLDPPVCHGDIKSVSHGSRAIDSLSNLVDGGRETCSSTRNVGLFYATSD